MFVIFVFCLYNIIITKCENQIWVKYYRRLFVLYVVKGNMGIKLMSYSIKVNFGG